MNIHFLGAHNCETREALYVSIMIDELLVLDAGGLTSSLSFPAQQWLRAVLLTHHHYDHIRDIPAIAMNLYLQSADIEVYSIQTVYDAVTSHLLNDRLYPRFHELPEEKPTIRFIVMKPHQTFKIDGYSVLAVPVRHSDAAVGYQVTSPSGKVLFYTGDTGPGLSSCWEHVSPQLLIIEVTATDRYEEWATRSGHLTPGLLRRELASFREIKGYLPRVITVHMNPRLEAEIKYEIASVAKELEASISLACEGMYFHL